MGYLIATVKGRILISVDYEISYHTDGKDKDCSQEVMDILKGLEDKTEVSNDRGAKFSKVTIEDVVSCEVVEIEEF